MLTFFQVIGALLMLFIAFNFCVMGFCWAIIGAIACIFLPYSIETCMAWGFGIGMVIQTLYNWRLMLRVIVSGLVGLLIAALVTWIMTKCGVGHEVCVVVAMYCLIISIFAGSSWMRDTLGDFISSPSSSSNDDDLRVAGILDDDRCSNCRFYDNILHRCPTTGREFVKDDNTCSQHRRPWNV